MTFTYTLSSELTLITDKHTEKHGSPALNSKPLQSKEAFIPPTILFIFVLNWSLEFKWASLALQKRATHYKPAQQALSLAKRALAPGSNDEGAVWNLHALNMCNKW